MTLRHKIGQRRDESGVMGGCGRMFYRYAKNLEMILLGIDENTPPYPARCPVSSRSTTPESTLYRLHPSRHLSEAGIVHQGWHNR